MIVQTERLLLREFSLDDAEAYHALESLPEVVRYQAYGPRTRAEAEDYVRKTVAAQRERPRRHVEMAVFHGGVFIGRVGAWIENGEASLWYAFLPSAQGKGFATEAMRAFVPQVSARGFKIECDPRNEPSWRLAERLGFVRESFVERAFENKGEWVGSVVYRRGGTL